MFQIKINHNELFVMYQHFASFKITETYENQNYGTQLTVNLPTGHQISKFVHANEHFQAPVVMKVEGVL
jgi:hypothetical protein